MKFEAQKKLLFNLSLIIIFIVFFISCSKDQGIPEKLCSTPDSVFYSVHIAPMFQNACSYTGCHTSGSSIGDLTTYSAVQLKVNDGSIENRVFNLKDMPPVYAPGPNKLDVCEQKVLRRWIEQGMQP